MVPITPMCTVLSEVNLPGSWNGQVLVSERTDPNVDHNFTAFRQMAGPRGNPAILVTNSTGIPDTYGISEAWLRVPGAPQVFRGQATPARRTLDLFGSGWNITDQGPNGTWSAAFTAGSANRGDEGDSPEVGALTVPQLMPVGLANPQMFACTGGRTQDNAGRTTWLIESNAPTLTGPGRSMLIQDLLYGDDRFVANPPFTPGPLSPIPGPPPLPPVPAVSGPGDTTGTGSVQCAMSQLDDDLNTRQLHMLAIKNGLLYHSMASNFGPVTAGSSTFNRFRTVSSWADVGQALGGGFGNIISAALVAHPNAISIFFVSEASGHFRLMHAVRFAAGGGSWRPVKDVFALSGDAANGLTQSFRVAAGTCPEFGATVWDAASTETLVAVYSGSSSGVRVIRVVSTPRQWQAGVNGVYSPLRSIPMGALNGPGPLSLRHVVVTARPFRDDAIPPPP
jgi:hypothetical protein